jgi:leader peptidase (prepilin peptidase) / N-methyltransferase
MIIFYVLLSMLIGFFTGRFMIKATHTLPIYLLACCDEANNSCASVSYDEANNSCASPSKIKLVAGQVGVAVLFGISVLLFPLNISLLFVLSASCLLICCFITDYEHGILPDQFTYSLLWIGLIASLFPLFATPQEAIIGAAAGYGVFWLINFIYRYFRGFDGMYPGDFKLNAAIGACVGIKWLLPMMIISMTLLIFVTVIYMLCRRKSQKANVLHQEIPYGCYASSVTLALLFYFTSLGGV